MATPVVRRVRLDFPEAARASAGSPPCIARTPTPRTSPSGSSPISTPRSRTWTRRSPASPRCSTPAASPVRCSPGWGASSTSSSTPIGTTPAPRDPQGASRPFPEAGNRGGAAQVIDLVFGITPVHPGMVDAAGLGGAGRPSRGCARTTPRGPMRGWVRSASSAGPGRGSIVGHSALGQAPLRGYGDPNLDPSNAEAYRFQLLVPRDGAAGPRPAARTGREPETRTHHGHGAQSAATGFVVGV